MAGCLGFRFGSGPSLGFWGGLGFGIRGVQGLVLEVWASGFGVRGALGFRVCRLRVFMGSGYVGFFRGLEAGSGARVAGL